MWNVETTDDKTGQWEQWYGRMVPIADDLFDAHLEQLEREKRR